MPIIETTKKYINGIEAIAGAKRSTARLADVLGADTTALAVSAEPSSTRDFLRAVKAEAPPDVTDGIGTIAGLGAGIVLFPEHRVLGAIGGASLGRNIPALLKSEERNLAIANMGQTGAAIAGSRLCHNRPVLGFFLGWLAGGAAIYFGGFRK